MPVFIIQAVQRSDDRLNSVRVISRWPYEAAGLQQAREFADATPAFAGWEKIDAFEVVTPEAATEAGDSAAGLKLLQSDVRHQRLADCGCGLRRPHDLKVLFITGYAENAILGNGHLMPGMAVLSKPFAIEAIASRIRSMIEAPPIALPQRDCRLREDLPAAVRGHAALSSSPARHHAASR